MSNDPCIIKVNCPAPEPEFDYKGFMSDFRIADHFGVSAVKDTYRRAFAEWKDNLEYCTALTLTLNHLIWFHYDRKNEELARIYDGFWKKTYNYGLNHFKGEELSKYIRDLD